MEEGNKKRFQRVAATKPTMIQWFMLLTAFGARKAFDAGQKLIAENHNLMTALLRAVVAFFLVVLLSTMLQCYFEYLSSSSTFLAILLILILAGVVLVLALTPLSRTVATATLGLWVITITVVVLFHYQNQLIANAMLGGKNQEVEGEIQTTTGSSQNNSKMGCKLQGNGPLLPLSLV